jgi:uncharacterized cupredoxin-like copper-binding protein
MVDARLAHGLLAVAAALTACKADRSAVATHSQSSVQTSESAEASPRSVTVTATDFGFDAPASVPAGPVTIHLVNHGKELHQVQLIKLEDGKSVADVAKALQHPGPTPAWVRFVGGPNGTIPGGEASSTSVLTAGNYAYLCLIPSPDGVMHAAKGMVRPFQVTSVSTASDVESPPADVTITLADYSFQPSQPLTAGRHTISVRNAGPQAHEIVLLKLAPGKKVADFAKWADTGMKGPPPAQPMGGVTVLDSGGQGTFTADLTAGDYGFICFVPDAKDGKPHLAHGMMQNFKVD